MPYGTKVQQREYQREWARRKRAGLPTRTKPILTKEERKARRKESKRQLAKKKKDMLFKLFGDDCYICHKKKKIMVLHRKDGMDHKKLSDMNLSELEALEENKYVRLCYGCHKHIHWAMIYLDVDFDW